MSVKTHTYVLVGAELGYQTVNAYCKERDDEDAFYDDFEQYVNRKNHKTGNFVIVMDGMGGDYLYAGVLVDYANHDDCDSVFAMVLPESLEVAVADARNKIKEVLGVDSTPALYVFTHYS